MSKEPTRCFVNNLIRDRFINIPIVGDGNCLFSSLGYILNKTNNVVRKEICDYLKNNIHKFSEYGIDQNYINNMSKNYTYGGYVEISVASILYNYSIIIYNKNGFNVYYNKSNKLIFLYHCSYDENYDPNHFELLIPINLHLILQDITNKNKLFVNDNITQENIRSLSKPYVKTLKLLNEQKKSQNNQSQINSDEEYAKLLEKEINDIESQISSDEKLARALQNKQKGGNKYYLKYKKYKEKYLLLKN
jgi:hypothetical protein